MRYHAKSPEPHRELRSLDEPRDEPEARPAREPGAVSAPDGEPNRCYVLSVARPGQPGLAEARLAEIAGLVEAQGDCVVGAETYLLSKPDPRTLIRRGVAARVAEAARGARASMLVVDAELSPSQTRNLEEATGLPICDREAVILNVFQRNATTRRSRIQVEIAHLEYLRPRIRGIGLNMDQQIGGFNKARGPGETASELLARRLDARLAELRRALGQLKRSDAAQRKHRVGAARVVLVGYTNAGKTSLMNALTGAGLSARDRPFETLETTSRCLSRHGGDILLSDTVGFIRKLPERLLASFESTLSETTEASLLLIVADASDPEVAEHLATTEGVLEKLGAGQIPRLVVLSKVDRLSAPLEGDTLGCLARPHPVLAVSSRDAHSVARLRDRILELVRESNRAREVFVPYEATAVASAIYARCRVIEQRASERGTRFVIEGPAHVVDGIARSAQAARAAG